MTSTPNTPLPHTIYNHLFDEELVQDFINAPLAKLLTWLQECIDWGCLPETGNQYDDSKALWEYYETVILNDTTLLSFRYLEEMLEQCSDTVTPLIRDVCDVDDDWISRFLSLSVEEIHTWKIEWYPSQIEIEPENSFTLDFFLFQEQNDYALEALEAITQIMDDAEVTEDESEDDYESDPPQFNPPSASVSNIARSA